VELKSLFLASRVVSLVRLTVLLLLALLDNLLPILSSITSYLNTLNLDPNFLTYNLSASIS